MGEPNAFQYRLRFSKTGRAAYLSHLDLMRCMQRAFLRADLPLKYSEGFNPHPLISILLPLPLGEESLCELMDFRLRSAVRPRLLTQELNRALPEGIRALDSALPERKVTELKFLRVEGSLEYDGGDFGELAAELKVLFSAETLTVTKRGKGGESALDIPPLIREIGFEAAENGVKLRAVLSAQGPTLSPELLIAALDQRAPELSPAYHLFRRIENYTADMEIFA